MASSILLPVGKRILPFLPYLPTPLLTLPASLGLHLSTHSNPSTLSFLRSSTTHPLHPGLIFTFLSIPLIYTLGLISGNVSWVDRAWPFYTPFCSALIVAWVWFNDSGAVYGHNLPRLFLMLGLQLAWSTRLLSHAVKRGFYDLTGEDYRYTAVRKIVPKSVFALIHVFVVAIAQPLLLFALSLPLQGVLVSPPSELSGGVGSISFGTVARFLPARFAPASLSTANVPVLNLGDLGVTLLAFGCLFVEWKADRAMYAYQTGKHGLMADLPESELVHPTPSTKSKSKPESKSKLDFPQPTAYPAAYHPGFPTKGLWRFSRHPNFAAEQLFWVTQALFVVAAGESSGVTRQGWMVGSIFGPCFALSLLFCSSTALTEWITSRKYPTYRAYKGLVGQFLPQETALVWLWGKLSGTRQTREREVYGELKGE